MIAQMDWQSILAAFALDLAIGDPVFFAHPVRLMGMAARRAEPVFRKIPANPVLSGALFASVLITASWGTAFLIHTAFTLFSPSLAMAADAVMLYFCLCARDLARSAMAVHDALSGGSEQPARDRLSMIVGRDVDRLDRSGIARASVETVAENLVDGVVSPLFFAAIGGAPFAVAYRMANTLDSMVGYRNERYERFGKAAARIDDVANLIPARVSILFVALASFLLGGRGRGRAALLTAVRQGRNHKSPNSGYPEAAFSGALGVWMGGPSYYAGTLVEKPLIGEGFADAAPGDIRRACDLMLLSSMFAAAAFALLCAAT